MPTIHLGDWQVPDWATNAVLIAGAILLALVVHLVGMGLARRIGRRTPGSAGEAVSEQAYRPTRWIAVAIALAAVRRFLDLTKGQDALWELLAGLITPALIGWLLASLVGSYQRVIDAHYDITVDDNLAARRRRTRVGILARIFTVLIFFLTVALMLLSIPSIRSIGVSLLASAGIVGLAVGAAAQPALKTIIGGVQMAFTEPIRLDDVIIIEGEWGRVEEIRLTYVVLKLWDERRMVVPVTKFLESSFQNWTRSSSQLLGSAFLYLDPVADIAALRARYEVEVKANPKWDGRGFALQVTGMKADAIEVRTLATARNSADSFDLQCELREAMLAWLRTAMPDALPSRRVRQLAPADPPRQSAAAP